MIDILEGYMDQFTGSTQQSPCSPSTHHHKAILHLKHIGYILHAWFPEVSACVRVRVSLIVFPASLEQKFVTYEWCAVILHEILKFSTSILTSSSAIANR